MRQKFQIGNHVRIKNLPMPEDIICDTGIITKAAARFARTPGMRDIRYDVTIDGRQGIYKNPIVTKVYKLTCGAEGLELVGD